MLATLTLLLLTQGSPVRAVEGNTLRSSALPEIEVRVDRALRYVGRYEIPLKGIALAERHLFAEADERGRVKRMFIAQFEGFLPGNKHTYKFPMRERVRLGENDYSFNTWFYDGAREARENPGTEGEATLRFLAKHGLRLDDQLMMARYARIIGDDRRHELIFFYQEPLAPTGLELSGIDEERPSAQYENARQAFVRRAQSAFSIVRG